MRNERGYLLSSSVKTVYEIEKDAIHGSHQNVNQSIDSSIIPIDFGSRRCFLTN